jgi:hypothetical protein
MQEIYPEFLARFVEKTKQLKVGDPLDPSVFMGAVNRYLCLSVLNKEYLLYTLVILETMHKETYGQYSLD